METTKNHIRTQLSLARNLIDDNQQDRAREVVTNLINDLQEKVRAEGQNSSLRNS